WVSAKRTRDGWQTDRRHLTASPARRKLPARIVRLALLAQGGASLGVIVAAKQRRNGQQFLAQTVAVGIDPGVVDQLFGHRQRLRRAAGDLARDLHRP